MKFFSSFFLLFALTIFSEIAYSQNVAVKTNLLYGALTYTPNLAIEIGLGKRTTLNISGGLNYWNMNNTVDTGKKIAHWIVQPEFRYWTCQRFNGHFFGVNAAYSLYNLGGRELPILLGKYSELYRYNGSAYGGGLSYGYMVNLTPRFALEFEIGAGYMHLDYNKFHAFKYGKFIGRDSHDYFGVTKAGVTLVWNLF